MDVSSLQEGTPQPTSSMMATSGEPVIEKEPTQEQPKEAPKTEATSDEERIAARFSALSRKEKDLVLKEKGIKDQIAKIKEFEDNQAKAKTDPLDYLAKSGLTLDDVLNAALGKKVEPTEADKITQLREELEAFKKAQQEEKLAAQRAREEQAVTAFKEQIKELIKSKPDDFEIIQAKELYDDVFDVVEENFKKTGQIMDINEAAKMVEDHYAADIRTILEKTKKFKAKTPTIESPAPELKGKGDNGISAERVQSPAPTLTNKLVSVSAPTAEERRLLTTEESLKKAASLLKWT